MMPSTELSESDFLPRTRPAQQHGGGGHQIVTTPVGRRARCAGPIPEANFMGLSERKDPALSQSAGNAQQPTQAEQDDESRRLRRLQIMMNMVISVISQDQDMTIEEASELAANAKRAALALFPDKEFAYDILYKPRLQRVIAERFRVQ